jgi:hypothetical protein
VARRSSRGVQTDVGGQGTVPYRETLSPETPYTRPPSQGYGETSPKPEGRRRALAGAVRPAPSFDGAQHVPSVVKGRSRGSLASLVRCCLPVDLLLFRACLAEAQTRTLYFDFEALELDVSSFTRSVAALNPRVVR